MKKITVNAVYENLDAALDLVNGEIEAYECDLRLATKIQVTVEEIFVNIASYAYAPKIGEVEITCEIKEDPPTLIVTFVDHGIPFNPLEAPLFDPDSEEDLDAIGGKGIYMIRQYMNDVRYRYENNSNILTIEKILNE